MMAVETQFKARLERDIETRCDKSTRLAVPSNSSSNARLPDDYLVCMPTDV